MADQRLTYGMSGKLNKNTFTKAGHDFRGWSAKKDVDYNPLNGSASLIDDEVSFALLPNARIDELTLYAMWAENGAIVYTVSFLDEDGETVLAPAKTVEANDAVVRPDDPEKDGFDFDGWHNGETAYDFDAPVTGDLTLFAGWEIPEFNGILKLPAGLTEIGVDAFVGTAAEAVVIPESVVTIEGNPFASGSVRYIFGFGGAAKTMTETYDYRWVLIDADWLAMH